MSQKFVDQNGMTVPTPPKVLVPLAEDVDDTSTVAPVYYGGYSTNGFSLGKTIVRTPDGWLHALSMYLQVPASWAIGYQCSRDGGLHWSVLVRVDAGGVTFNSYFPCIAYTIDYTATDPVVLHVAYLESVDLSPYGTGTIKYTRLRNGSWSVPVAVSTVVLDYNIWFETLSIAATHTPGQVVVAWSGLKSGTFYLKYAASGDHGATWAAEANITSLTSGDADDPGLRFGFAWSSHTTNDFYVTYIKRLGAGSYALGFADWTYGDPGWHIVSTGISDNIVISSGETEIDGSLDIVYINGGGSGVQFIRSTDNGATWGAPSQVVGALMAGTSPQVCGSASDGDYYCVAFTHTVGGNEQIGVVTGKPGAWNASIDITTSVNGATTPSIVQLFNTPPSLATENRFGIAYSELDEFLMAFQCNKWGWGATPIFANTGAGNCPTLQYAGDTVKFEPVQWPDDTYTQKGYGLFVTLEASTAYPTLHLYYTTTFYNVGDSKAYCDGIDGYFVTSIAEGIQKIQLTTVGAVVDGNPPTGSMLAGGFMLVTNDLDRPLRIVSVTLEPVP